MADVGEMSEAERLEEAALDAAIAATDAAVVDDDAAGVDQAQATVATTDTAPAAVSKKRRGRPPGRPNMTVREAEYDSNGLVQAWNAAKSESAIPVVAVNVRAALTESLLVHDTQRAIFRKYSREFIYFVQGWITARHIASQRPSYVNGLLIHSRGVDAPTSCAQCQERRNKNALGPFLICRILPGSYHNSCSNCKWFDNTSACSLYTGPKPNRKRKAKETLTPADANDVFASAPAAMPPQQTPNGEEDAQDQDTAMKSQLEPEAEVEAGGEAEEADFGVEHEESNHNDADDAQLAT
ncbi:hypothetical protein B0H63DRAFT_469722 [Podospora didyma]|uniref:Uncharacterized protein n=1 Tax=Podospora didyma TaxID=330526 RepID=A0AAE0NT95_9PEZI|nr:hypothetical protein B0H63DRAFT_469722 [Podospora didyma]